MAEVEIAEPAPCVDASTRPEDGAACAVAKDCNSPSLCFRATCEAGSCVYQENPGCAFCADGGAS